jgi:hypothetical protein
MLAFYHANKNPLNPMNTNFAQGVPRSPCIANGGDYVPEGMSGLQQLSVCALMQTV